MRSKVTFRDRRPKLAFWGIRSPDDANLDAEFAASLAMWRAKYMRFKDRTLTPYRMDVSATLEALAKLPDESAGNAVRLLDSETYSYLKCAAYLDYRREHSEPAPIPPSALAIRHTSHGRAVLSISPQRLRDLASLALSVLPKNQGGRPRINSLDHLFACALVCYWGKLGKSLKGKLFKVWASDMFELVGAPRKDLNAVLRHAIQICKKRKMG